ncbi:hypothetical protein PINS_up013727 [Pythium insidiosum]|nr:hypothetical protein PINS_up013727 [Pythium insidiosum]
MLLPEQCLSPQEDLRRTNAVLVAERDRLRSRLDQSTSLLRAVNAHKSDVRRERVGRVEKENQRLEDSLQSVEADLADYEKLGTPVELLCAMQAFNVYRQFGSPEEVKTFAESAGAEMSMLRALVRELTAELGHYETLLGPLVLSLSRQEALVASLVCSAYPPPLPGGTSIQPLAPPVVPRVLAAIVNAVPDDIANMPPSPLAAAERVEMGIADAESASGGDSALSTSLRRLAAQVRDGLRDRPALRDIQALRRQLNLGGGRLSDWAELRGRAQRRSLIEAARATASAHGSALAKASLRPDLSYALSDSDDAHDETTRASALAVKCSASPSDGPPLKKARSSPAFDPTGVAAVDRRGA